MGSSKTKKPASPAGCLCASIPWVQFGCTLAILAGLVVFFVKTAEAFASVRSMLGDLKVTPSAQSKAAAIMSGLGGAGIAVVLAALLLAVLALLAAFAGNGRRYKLRHGAKADKAAKSGACCQMGTSVLVVVLMWLVLALVVALIAIWTAFLLGSISGDSGAAFAMGHTDGIQQKLAGALSKVDSLFQKMKGAWDRLSSKVPSFLKGNTWFQELSADIGGPIVTGASDMANVTCPENCLDLGVFATMVSFEPRCVCGKDMLTSIQSRMRVAWKSALASLIALVVVAVAASWILMAQISGFVHARRDRGDISDMLEDQGDGADEKLSPAAATTDLEAAAPDQVVTSEQVMAKV